MCVYLCVHDGKKELCFLLFVDRSFLSTNKRNVNLAVGEPLKVKKEKFVVL